MKMALAILMSFASSWAFAEGDIENTMEGSATASYVLGINDRSEVIRSLGIEADRNAKSECVALGHDFASRSSAYRVREKYLGYYASLSRMTVSANYICGNDEGLICHGPPGSYKYCEF